MFGPKTSAQTLFSLQIQSLLTKASALCLSVGTVAHLGKLHFYKSRHANFPTSVLNFFQDAIVCIRKRLQGVVALSPGSNLLRNKK